MTLLTPPLHEWPDNAELRYRYEERAGICEYEGGMTRAEAEAYALQITWAEYAQNPQHFQRNSVSLGRRK